MSNPFFRSQKRARRRRGRRGGASKRAGGRPSQGAARAARPIRDGGYRQVPEEVLIGRLEAFRDWLLMERHGVEVWTSVQEMIVQEAKRQFRTGKVDKVFRCYLTTLMSMKAWNKLMHALNGNILGWSLADGARWLLGWTGRQYRTTVKLSEAETLVVKARIVEEGPVVGVCQPLPSFNPAWIEEMLESFVAAGFIEECNHEASCDLYRLVARADSYSGPFDSRGRPHRGGHALLEVAPYLCSYNLVASLHAMRPLTGPNAYGFPFESGALIGPFTLTLPRPLAPRTCGHDRVLPTGPSDELGGIAQGVIYRPELENDGWRCPRCYPKMQHYTSPAVVRRLTEPDAMDISARQMMYVAHHAMRVRVHWESIGSPERVTVVAASSGYPLSGSMVAPRGDIFVLCDDAAQVVVPDGPWTFHKFTMPLIQGPRSLALWRLIVANVFAAGTEVHVINGRQAGVVTPGLSDWVASDMPQSYRNNLVAPCAGTLRFIAGKVDYISNMNLPVALKLADWYGIDELLLQQEEMIIIALPGHRGHNEDALRTPIWQLPGEGWYATRAGRSAVKVGDRSRKAAAMALSLLVESTEYSPLHPGRGSFTDLSVGDLDGPRRVQRTAVEPFPDSSVLVFCTFGTRGDHIPIKALARYAATLGFNVFALPLCTEEEGREMLDGVERSGLSPGMVALWASASSSLLALPGTVVAPKQLREGHIRYTYEGPDWYAHSAHFGLPKPLEVLYGLFIGTDAVMRVGSWADIDCVPRSTEGRHFDEYYPSKGRKHRACFVPGSSAITGPDGVPVLPAGDHSKMLRDYEVAYVVGLGTAQTAAAAGCRVVMVSDALDRNVKKPLDAGAGLYFGASPSRLLSHIALTDANMFMLVFPLMSWLGLLHCFALGFQRGWRRVLFALVTVAVAIQRLPYRVKPGPGFVQTIILSMFGLDTPLAVVVLALFSSLAQVLLPELHVNLYVITVQLLWVVVTALDDPLTYALSYAGWPFVLAALAARLAYYLAKLGLHLSLATYAGCVRPQSWLQARFFWVGWLPVVHTRFMNVEGTEIAEGSFDGAAGAFVPYYFKVKAFRPELEPPDWMISIPIPISWTEISSVRAPAGYYSVVHNCQTLILGAVGPARVRLGAGVFILLPLLAFTSIVMFLLVFVALFLVCLYALVAPITLATASPDLIGLRHPTMKAWSILQALVQPAPSLIDRALRVVIVAQWSWSTSQSSLLAGLWNVEEHMELSEALGVVRDTYRRDMGRPLPATVERMVRDLLAATAGPAQAVREPSALLSDIMAETFVRVELYQAIEAEANSVLDQEEDSPEARVAREFCRIVSVFDEVDPDAGWAYSDLLPYVRQGCQMFHYGAAVYEQLTEWCEEQVGYVPTGLAERVLRWLFFEDARDEEPDDQAIPDAQIEAVAEAVAELERAGADNRFALEAAAMELAGYEHVESGSSAGVDQALQLFEEYVAASDKLKQVHLNLTSWAFRTRQFCVQHGVVLYAPLEFATLVTFRVTQDMSKILSIVVQPLLDAWSGAAIGSDLRSGLAIAFASFLDVIDVRHRVTPKPAWALLLGKHKFRMSRGDAMMASFAMTRYVPPASYEDWASKMIALMDDKSGAVDVLLSSPPTRALFFPRHTYGIQSNEQFIAGFDVRIDETQRELRRLREAIRFGGQPAIDQAWMATVSNMNVSMSRYTIKRPEPSLMGRAKITEAADSLFDDFPEMYDAPRAMTVKQVINATIWKYSAGLPFLPVIRKREQLRNSSWITRIELAVSRMLQSGEFPGVALHGFPKNQLVALSKLVDDGKPIRQVVAGDRLTAIAYNTLAMERNKRPPPARALILPSFTRSEGGMQEVYRALGSQPHFFTGDAHQFDSTVVSELAVEGPVQLWRRGVEGNWGETATTSFMRAYYQGLADGQIVSLMDGTVVRKTGGGGTGSAATTPDNRDWVRIALRASWSICTGLPCSEFTEHVVLANASDDIAFSCDDMTAARVNDWRAIMQVEYGVQFDFDTSDDYGGILHLKIVDNPDLDMYAEAGVNPNEVVVRHDPARLFTMRSEYRADRMNHTFLRDYDVLATQAVGHALLTAHSPEAYSAICHDWEEAVSGMLLSAFNEVEFMRLTNDNGHTVGSSVVVTDVKPPRRLIEASGRFHQSSAELWTVTQQQRVRRWLRAVRMPTYLEVFKLWVQPPPIERMTARRYARLPTGVASPMIDSVRMGLQQSLAITHSYPAGLKKLQGELDLYQLPGRYVTTDHVYETYVYYRALDRLKRLPTQGEMSALIRQSPFAGVSDLFGFMIRLRDPAESEKLLQPTLQEKSQVTFRVLLSLGIYTMSDVILRKLSQFRVLGTLLMFAFAFLVVVDTLYSFLNLVHWAATGTSSLAISNLMIRDPYLVLKMLSLVLATAVPWPWVPSNLYHWVAQLQWLSDFLLVGVQVKVLPGSMVHSIVALQQGDPMEGACNAFLREPPGTPVLLIAGMSTGKSTKFLSFLLQSGIQRVILAVPTNLLVRTYHNPFVAEHLVQRMTSEDVAQLPAQGIVVMTAGLLSRMLPGNPAPGGLAGVPSDVLGTFRNTVVAVDEVGLGTVEQAVCMLVPRYYGAKIVGMTGTPDSPLCASLHTNVIQVPARRQFALHAERIPAGEDFVTAVSRAVTDPNRPGRVLVIDPRLAELEKLALSVKSQLGHHCVVVSRENPIAPPQGHIFATSIADTGVNFSPGPSTLVDSGLAHARIPAVIAVTDALGRSHPPASPAQARLNLYHHLFMWTSASIAAQRSARVGRQSDGVSYQPEKSGTGLFLHSIPSVTLLLSLEPSLRAEVIRLCGIAFPCLFERLRGHRALLTFDLTQAVNWDPAWALWEREACALWIFCVDLGGYELARQELLFTRGTHLGYAAARRVCGLLELTPGAWNNAYADRRLLACAKLRQDNGPPVHRLLAFDPVSNGFMFV